MGNPSPEPGDRPGPGGRPDSLAQLRADLDRLARQVQELRAAVRAAADRSTAIDELSTQVGQLADRLVPPNAHAPPAVATRLPGVVAWVDIGPDRAPAVLVDLAGWIRTVLAYHRVVDHLHPCWYRHPALVQALLDVRAAWLSAYRDPAGGRMLAALDWSQRHLPYLERRVREQLSRCSSTRHQPPAAPLPPASEPEVRAYAHWWAADRRPGTEPAPPPPAAPGRGEPGGPLGPGAAPGRRPLSPPATGARGIPQPRPRNGTEPTDRRGGPGEGDR